VIPFSTTRDRVPPVTRVRSTLIASSLQAVRDRKLLDRYQSFLPREYHDVVLQSIAGTWLSVDAGAAHYRAMDALNLSSGEVVDVGRSVAEKVQGTVLATLAKLATGSGVTPWSGLAQLHRLWGRIFIGGAVAVAKRGPKEAVCDIVGNPLLEIPYFRVGFRGLATGGLNLFCSKVYVTEVGRSSESHRLVLRVAWA
jgi:hypothetical protein